MNSVKARQRVFGKNFEVKIIEVSSLETAEIEVSR